MLEPCRTAVVAIDMINHQLSPDRGMIASLRGGGTSVDYFMHRVERTVIPNHVRLLDACRAAGVRVVYSRIGGFAPGGADLGPNVRAISKWGTRADTQDCDVIAELAPQPGDLSILKTGSGAFTTSSLDLHLRNMGIEDILYTGVITNGCVTLTALAGFDLGYRGYVVTDCTATMSDTAQAFGEQVLSGFTEGLVTTDAVLESMAGGDLVMRARIAPTLAFTTSMPDR